MNEEEKNCIFCKIIGGEIPANKVYENKNFTAILDIHPKTEGHTIIIPKKHFNTILDIPNSMGDEMLEAIKYIGFNLIKGGKGGGFNLIVNNGEAAGQIVQHAHIHVIPRKKGDGMKGMV